MSHENPANPRGELQEMLITRVFDLAFEAARGKNRGEPFSVTIPRQEVNDIQKITGINNAHYAEITGPLAMRSDNKGYIFHANTGQNWTYGFTKV